jgi:hypothetical protein
MSRSREVCGPALKGWTTNGGLGLERQGKEWDDSDFILTKEFKKDKNLN